MLRHNILAKFITKCFVGQIITSIITWVQKLEIIEDCDDGNIDNSMTNHIKQHSDAALMQFI